MLDADTVEQAITRTFAYTGIPCPWDDSTWDKFVVSLCKELTRGADAAGAETLDSDLTPDGDGEET